MLNVSSKKASNGSVSGQFEQQCIMHSLEVQSHTINSTELCTYTPNFTALTNNVCFREWCLQSLMLLQNQNIFVINMAFII